MKDNSKIEILIIKSITKIICDLKSMWKIIQLFFFYIFYISKKITKNWEQVKFSLQQIIFPPHNKNRSRSYKNPLHNVSAMNKARLSRVTNSRWKKVS